MSRTQRLFDLLSVLRARGRTTVGELAADVGVSTRTIHRDLADLLEVGVPVVTEPGRYGGVTLLPGGRATVSGLSAREKDLLRITGLDTERAAQLGQEALAQAAVGKLTSGSGATGLDRRPGLLPLSEVVTVDNQPWFAAARREPDVAGLAEAVRTGCRLVISYRRSGENTVEQRTVDPYGLLGRSGRWYLVADRDGTPRQYAVERLNGWEELDAPRRLRPQQTLETVVAELATGLEHPATSVIVVADLDVTSVDLARRILGARLESVDVHGATATIRVRYRQMEGVRQLLQFGDHIEITDPPEARALTGRLGAEIARRHLD